MPSTLTKQKLVQVIERYGRQLALGRQLTTYKCAHCKKDVLVEAPLDVHVGTKGYWDSATCCLLCGGMNFVLTWPSGQTEVKKM